MKSRASVLTRPSAGFYELDFSVQLHFVACHDDAGLGQGTPGEPAGFAAQLPFHRKAGLGLSAGVCHRAGSPFHCWLQSHCISLIFTTTPAASPGVARAGSGLRTRPHGDTSATRDTPTPRGYVYCHDPSTTIRLLHRVRPLMLRLPTLPHLRPSGRHGRGAGASSLPE